MEQLNLDKYDKIILLTPHPDDEIIGCSCLFQNNDWKDKLFIMYLTDGCFYKYPEIRSLEAKSIRYKELDKLCKEQNIDYSYLAFKDTHLSENITSCTSSILDILHEKDLINSNLAWFIPYSHDRHSDHSCVKSIQETLMTMLKDTLVSNYIFIEYEVWTPIRQPDCFSVIDSINKIKLLNYYQSQIMNLPYIDGVLGLNKYRGLQELSNDYMEVFKYGGLYERKVYN